jgi:hypothetical protein
MNARQRSSLYTKAAFYSGTEAGCELKRLLRVESKVSRRLLTVRTTEGIFDFEPLFRD